ncbi:hypothetical protein CTAYLR_007592 [Chrysophaeum taylorii]|uniref:Copper homeostasis protein cutC homolog n=1 Tax=Chrysophaeum taylorii TaxID=2483200 RepID=A0AAD7UB21_9STRA|nr:hypothetical protein CTAYLR_007592 [Chrysophaeum taylorii]
MVDDIHALKTVGIREFAVGALREGVDGAALEKLVTAAKPGKVVFHRAIDELLRRGFSPDDVIGELKNFGIDRVLSSGGGVEADARGLANLKRACDRNGIELVAAGKIDVVKIPRLAFATQFHAGSSVHETVCAEKTDDLFRAMACQRVTTSKVARLLDAIRRAVP